MTSPHCRSKFTNSCVSPPKIRQELDKTIADRGPHLVGVEGKELPLTNRRKEALFLGNTRLRRSYSLRQVDVLRAELHKAKTDNLQTLSAIDKILEDNYSTTMAATRAMSRSLDEGMFTRAGIVRGVTGNPAVNSPTVVFNRARDAEGANTQVWISNSDSAPEIVDAVSPNNYCGFVATSDSEMENKLSGSAPSSMESLQDEMSSSGDENSDSQVSSLTIESYASAQDHSSGREIISSMWDDFSIEDYMPHEGKVIDVTKTKNRWYPCVTVPRPFSMTIREQNAANRQSRSAMIAEKEKLEKEVCEEFELSKKFKAIPVPASTYIPLYQLLVVENEQRRAQIKQSCKEMLKASEQPFSFMNREERNKMLLKKQEHPAEKKVVKPFVARPAPQHLFAVNKEKMQELEEYREIKKKVRSREILQQSKLPKSMQIRGREYTIGALRKKQLEEREKKAFLTEEHHFQPKVTAKVPDYVQSHLENEIQLARSKQFNKNTTVEPFNLKTQLIPSRIDKVYEDIAKDEENLPETRWPYKSPRTPIKSDHSRSFSGPSQYSTMTTEASRLWEAANKKKLELTAQKELEEERKHQERQKKERSIRQRVSDKVKLSDRSDEVWKHQENKQAAFRALQKSKEIEYQLQLEEMTERLNSRPLLLERTSLESARKMAEAKYVAALKKAGLNDGEIKELNNL